MTVDFDTTAIPCKHCDNGLVRNHFTGNLDNCSKCHGEAEIFVCHSFSTTKISTIMSTQCDQCHATKSQHLLVSEYEGLVSQD